MPHIKNALIRYRIIDKCLKNKYKPFPTKQDLRQECEDALYGSVSGEHICDSTIEKDMFAMKMEHDAPIKYSKIERGYYYEDPDFSINDVPLNENDLESIRFAANTLFQFKDVQMFKQFGSTLDKIINKVSVSSNFTQEEGDSIIQFETAPSIGGQEYINDLLNAIKFNKIVEFDYKGFKGGKAKKRKVVGYLLKEYRNRWYLISYSLKKERVITFALDRINDLVVTEENKEVPSFDSRNFFQHVVGITSFDGEPDTILFKADKVAAKYIESQPLHSSQKLIKDGKNRVSFELTAYPSEELIRIFLSYAGEIEIIAPQSLREEVKLRAQKMYNTYEKN